jgi:predicted RNA-binding Zn-ribbon protein involved in translation (DUF1610 family)
MIFEKKRKCPSCGSKKVEEEKKGFRKGMALLGPIGLITEGIRSQQTHFVCQKCGTTWEEK